MEELGLLSAAATKGMADRGEIGLTDLGLKTPDFTHRDIKSLKLLLHMASERANYGERQKVAALPLSLRHIRLLCVSRVCVVSRMPSEDTGGRRAMPLQLFVHCQLLDIVN